MREFLSNSTLSSKPEALNEAHGCSFLLYSAFTCVFRFLQSTAVQIQYPTLSLESLGLLTAHVAPFLKYTAQIGGKRADFVAHGTSE